MEKSIYILFFIVLAISISFWRLLALNLGLDIDFDPITEKVLGTIERLILSLLWIKVIIKFGYVKFNGLRRRKIANPYALLPPVGIMLLFLAMKILSTDTLLLSDMAIIAMFYLSVGMSEELLMRGIVYPFLIEKLGTSKKMIFLAALLSSVIFGLLHFINLMNPKGSLDDVLGQVITSVPVGFFFAALLLKVESIWAVALLHGLVNIALGSSSLEPGNRVVEDPNYETDWVSVITFYAVFGLIFMNGVLIIKKVDSERVRRLLNIRQHATS